MEWAPVTAAPGGPEAAPAARPAQATCAVDSRYIEEVWGTEGEKPIKTPVRARFTSSAADDASCGPAERPGIPPPVTAAPGGP
eukprot:10327330-Prorocentrum_lima.AAC.1